jgi:hypothetical protein
LLTETQDDLLTHIECQRCDPDILNIKGEPILIYAMKTNKYQSFEILLDFGKADPTYPADESRNIIQTTAISEAMVH